jgi:restriction endonuclease Mrr
MIPDFQSVFLPYLKFFSDGKNHSSREIEDVIAKQFNITDEERREMIPSGELRDSQTELRGPGLTYDKPILSRMFR